MSTKLRSPLQKAGATTAKTKDEGRKWMWWFLAVLGALQLYFVRELIAAFALFAAGFAAIAMVLAAGYTAKLGWEYAVARLAGSGQHAVSVALREKVKAN